MLGNFFRINMPYGIIRNENGEWMAFNREYMPLGFNDIRDTIVECQTLFRDAQFGQSIKRCMRRLC